MNLLSHLLDIFLYQFCFNQSYVIKFAPWTILWFRILRIFSVENIKRLCVFMFQTCSNSQLLRRVLWISAEQTIGASLKHKNTQPLYMFNRVRVLHLNRLKERTWLHSFAPGSDRPALLWECNDENCICKMISTLIRFWLIFSTYLYNLDGESCLILTARANKGLTSTINRRSILVKFVKIRNSFFGLYQSIWLAVQL